MYADLGPGLGIDLVDTSPNGIEVLYDHQYVATHMQSRRRDNGKRRETDEVNETNLYLYVRNNPLRFVDPLGLQGIDCNWYKQQCECVSWWNICQKAYYCFAADIVCENAGNAAWSNCVRTCLQCRDLNLGGLHGVENSNPIFSILFGCVVHLGSEILDHAICFAECAWDTSSYKNGCQSGGRKIPGY